MKIRASLYLLVFLISSVENFSFSQNVLLSEKPASDTMEVNWGQNRKHYAHVYGSIMVVTPPNYDGAQIIYGLSRSGQIGIRYKYKLNRFLAIGSESFYDKSVFNILQNAKKKLPDNMQHEKERFIFHSIGLAVFQRVNFGRRGNIIGKYFDLGIFIKEHLASRYFISDKISSLSTYVDSYYKNPKFINQSDYGLIFRLGWNKFALHSTYRLSDFFSKYNNVELPELPRISVGIDFALAFRN